MGAHEHTDDDLDQAAATMPEVEPRDTPIGADLADPATRPRAHSILDIADDGTDPVPPPRPVRG